MNLNRDVAARAWHRLAILGIASFGLAVGAPASGAATSDRAAAQTQSTQDNASVLVQLDAEPLATYVQTRPAQGRKIDFNANTVKAYRAQLAAQRNNFKAWLRTNVPQAKVTGEFDISLNALAVQLNGATLAQIAAGPQVKRVEYQGIYRPTAANDPDLSLISAQAAWTVAGGPANAGAGVKVAVIDSGIDVKHPCFSDAGYPAQPQIGDRRFTNNKVIAAKVFNNRQPVLRFTPEAIESHGTHVAGTVACNLDTPAVVDGVAIPYPISGVAPRALLGNYNVFPATTDSARSEDILNALETSYADGFDVANMSLGGGSVGKQDLVTVAVDNLDRANMVIAVAAGNSGPGLFTVESPGSAERALTAGASTVGHMIATPVTAAGQTHPAVAGVFAVVEEDLTAPLDAVTDGSSLGLACSALPANSLAGKIALIGRGTCTFAAKIRNAQTAGAVAALIANNLPGDPVPMGDDGTPNQPTIPAYMVSRDAGPALMAVEGAATTIHAAPAYFLTGNDNFMADFSSAGPTDVDFRVKPDVVAPGAKVLSSFPANACEEPPCFAFLNGTSMATPHLAGSAAVVRGRHPTWSAAEIRSAIVNTAQVGVLKNFRTGLPETNVNVMGAGLEDLLDAITAPAALDPVSVSFGAIPAISGIARTVPVTLRNLDSVAHTWALATTGGDASVVFGVSPAEVTLAPGASTTIAVTMSAAKGAAFGPHQGGLEVRAGSAAIAHAALFTIIK